MTLDFFTTDLDYSITTQKVSKGVFQITFKVLKSLQTSTFTAHFTYSPSNLLVKTDLGMPRVVYISSTLQAIAQMVKGGSYASFSLLMILAAIFALTGGLSVIWSFLPENQYSYYLLYLNVQYPYQASVYFRSLANYNVLFTSKSPQSDDMSNVGKNIRNSMPQNLLMRAIRVASIAIFGASWRWSWWS